MYGIKRTLNFSVMVTLLLVTSGPFWVEAQTLQAEADAALRTDLSARRNDNYGCSPFLVVGGSRGGGGIANGGPDGIRSLIRFDLGGITHPVQSAILRLRIVHIFSFSPPQIYTLDVHRVTESWTEGNGLTEFPMPSGCVHVDPASGVAWVGAGDGGDSNNQTQPNFASAVIDTAVGDESTASGSGNSIGTGESVQWDITSLVNDWITGAVPNHELILRDTTSDGSFKHIFLGAREGDLFAFSDPRQQPGPRLVLTMATGPRCNGVPAPIVGTRRNDNLRGTNGDDVIVGRGGNDTINGRGGNDLICGDAGNDTLIGANGEDELRGGGDNDELRGSSGNDDLRGGAGNDLLIGGGNNDVLRGGSGDDELRGGTGNDDLRGGADTDICRGGPGTDTASGCEDLKQAPKHRMAWRLFAPEETELRRGRLPWL